MTNQMLDVRPATWTFPLTAHAPRISSIEPPTVSLRSMASSYPHTISHITGASFSPIARNAYVRALINGGSSGMTIIPPSEMIFLEVTHFAMVSNISFPS